MRLSDFQVLSFDCYGTLIDWERGITQALQQLVDAAGGSTRDEVLEPFGLYEARQQALTPKLIYPEILARVYGSLAESWGVASTPWEARAFGSSVPDWPAFEDSAPALQYLKRHYCLVILSNVDRPSFRASEAKLGVEFDYVFTAEDIGSYKPSDRNFTYMIDRLATHGIEKEHVLHTAQSLFHDHVPANRAGLHSAWINRRGDNSGPGATAHPDVMPHVDFEFPTLEALARAHQSELGRGGS